MLNANKDSQGNDSGDEPIEKATFSEEQDMVEFEVKNARDDFASDSESESESEGKVSDGDDEDTQTDKTDTQSDSESEGEINSSQEPEGDRRRPRSVVEKDTHSKDNRRESVEDKLDSLSTTLSVMQDMMLKKGFFEIETNEKQKRRKKNSGRVSVSDFVMEASQPSASETTIYQNTVEPVDDTNELDVDPEISFKLKRLRESTSSEEQDQIDTSDELIEHDFVDKDHGWKDKDQPQRRHADRED